MLLCVHVSAQPGTPDLSFSDDGSVQFGDNIDFLYGNDMVVRSGGNIIIAGTRSKVSPTVDLMTYTEFSAGGNVFNIGSFGDPGRQHFGLAIALQPDEKIILAGYSRPAGSSGNNSIELIRIGTTGELDANFGTNGVVLTDLPGGDEWAVDVAVLANGKIVVAGNSSDGPVLVRYNADGTLDEAGFGDNGVASSDLGPFSTIGQMVIATNGDILVSGITFTDTDVAMVLSFSSAGIANTGFADQGVALVPTGSGTAYSTAIDIEPSGTILLGVSADPIEIHRLTSAGQVGTGLPSGGQLVTDQFHFTDLPLRVLSQPDGRFLLSFTGGTSQAMRWKALRYLENGSADPSFTAYQSPIAGAPVYMYASALQADGKILLGGSINLVRSFAVTRLMNELTVGVADVAGTTNTLLIYPNPIANEAAFTYSLETPGTVSIELMNSAGELVRTYTSNAARQIGTHTQLLDMGSLASGAYHVVLSTGTGHVTVQVMKL